MGQRRHVSLDQKVAFLRDPRSYPHHAGKVSAIETHFAWIFLAGRYAYKLKKPVRHEVIDYRTLEARERACRAELRLNRRLAQSIYLSVVPLTRHDRALALGDHGQVEDWLVKMRRLPATRMLESTLLRRTLRASELDRLVATLVGFFAVAERTPLQGERYLRRLQQQVHANCRALRAAGSGIDQQRADVVANAQRRILERAEKLLRARGPRLVDGHGDLRLEHVYLGPPICVIDCLEFSRELRRLDPFEEIAFLALEIERVGRPRLAAELIRRFSAASHARIPPAIMCFYMSHRASTRAKLTAWHLGDPQYPDPEPWLARANSYLLEAERHACHALRLLSSGRSRLVRGRPALEQRRQRRSAKHAHQGLPEKRTNGQNSYAAGA